MNADVESALGTSLTLDGLTAASDVSEAFCGTHLIGVVVSAAGTARWINMGNKAMDGTLLLVLVQRYLSILETGRLHTQTVRERRCLCVVEPENKNAGLCS